MARHRAAFVWDPGQQVGVLFGGDDPATGELCPADVWELVPPRG